MKSNGSPLTSDKRSKPMPKTWELLQESRAELIKLRDLHHNSLWDSLLGLLQAERHFHLEALAETDDDSEAHDHRLIARYLKHFMEFVPEEVASMVEHAKAEAEGKIEKLEPGSGGTPYMESDGDEPEVDATP